MPPLDSSRVISGSFAKVIDADGTWLTNVNNVTAEVEISYEDVPRSGTRWIGHKVMSLNGTGTIGGYFVTTEFLERIGRITDDRLAPYVTQLIVELDDPEAFGAYRVRLKDVQFETIPIANFEIGTFSEFELTFNFAGYDVLDHITE